MFCPRLNTLSLCITTLLALGVRSAEAYSLNPFTLSQELSQKLEEKTFLPVTEFYAAEKWFYLNGVIDRPELEMASGVQKLESCQGFPHRPLYSHYECYSVVESHFFDASKKRHAYFVTQSHGNNRLQILQIFDANLQQNVPAWAHQPRLLAQTVGSQPIMQKKLPLSEMPASCLQAVLAIEDTSFLEHGGVSITGTARAFIKNLTSGKKAQGGSTITQQLVKNYFLTPERTYKRKIQEIMLAVLLESQFTKDQILETYLNIIYMAQNGPYQVVGYPAASEFYFQKSIQNLLPSECALLAAILNGPGVFNPFRNPDKALARRNRVLEKMKEQNYLTSNQYDQAVISPLPTKVPVLAAETSPYFLNAARDELKKNNIGPENKKILLTLDLKAQDEAQKAVQSHLNFLEDKNPKIARIKSDLKKSLEGLVLSVDNYGRARVAVGGRNFRQSQFNRITQSRRQVGSLIKPFVYLAAIDKLSLTPESLLVDEKWQVKIHNQTWSPANYDRKFNGPVPLYYAIKMSLNVPVAKLLHEIGPETLIEYLRILGVESPLEPHLAISLGAAEMTAVEMIQAYSALSQFGKVHPVSFVDGLWHSNGQPVELEAPLPTSSVLKPQSVAVVVGALKHTLTSGTAQSAKNAGLVHFWAGKTGTTSDNRDAWFVGFNAFETTLTWVGYDDNTSGGLTGASGALPIWMKYTQMHRGLWPEIDFTWPEETESRQVDLKGLETKGFNLETEKDITLIFEN